MANTNPGFVMCPSGEQPYQASATTISCAINGTPQNTPIYLGDTVSFGGIASAQDSFNDGMTLGWGVVAAMVAAWAIVALRKALFR